MIPNPDLITIRDNVALIERMLIEMVFMPRLKALEFSKITHQTPNMKIGYPAQHLASLVTGMFGSRTGGRGDDIVDGSEVKACSLIDQLDKCKDCGSKVARSENICPNPECGSKNIKRNDDSKWLFPIKNKEALHLLTVEVPRVILIVSDYPEFSNGNFDFIRIEVFEIWNGSERNKVFTQYMTHYYNNIYLEHLRVNPEKDNVAPKNLFPYGYPFYMCNPTKVFSCLVHDVNVDPRIETIFYLEPDVDRSTIPSENMPTFLLENKEINELIAGIPLADITPLLKDITPERYEELKAAKAFNYDNFIRYVPFLNETAKRHLPLREMGGIRVAKEKYVRREKKA